MLEFNGFEVYWDGHASVRVVDEGFTVAVDPFSDVSPDFKADLILVTHNNIGHFDPEMLPKICNSQTCVVLPESMEDVELPCDDIEYISEDETIDIFGIEIESVPMYVDKEEKGEGFGYCFVMRGTSFYVAGDTGLTDEIWDLEGRVDMAFLPVEGVHTMDVEEAVKTAVRIKAGLTIPYHYGPPFYSDEEVDLRGMKAELEDRNIGCEIIDPGNK